MTIINVMGTSEPMWIFRCECGNLHKRWSGTKHPYYPGDTRKYSCRACGTSRVVHTVVAVEFVKYNDVDDPILDAQMVALELKGGIPNHTGYLIIPANLEEIC